MAYTIRLQIDQANAPDIFQVVEKTVWNFANGGTWTEADGAQVLTMGGSGTSGTLRFKSAAGTSFLLALGVHNYVPWVDLQADLGTDQTATTMHPAYYVEGTAQAEARWAQRNHWEVDTAAGQHVDINVNGAGHDFDAILVIM